jgi:hypothetical protein
MPALGFDRWQRKDINASIAYGSKFATVAGWNRIKKWRDSSGMTRGYP